MHSGDAGHFRVRGGHDNVDAIGLAYEDSDKADIVDFLAKHPVSYPVAQVSVDDPPKDFDEPRGLPTTYLIAPGWPRSPSASSARSRPRRWQRPSAQALMPAARFLVRGQVQGVFFRASTRERALALGLDGTPATWPTARSKCWPRVMRRRWTALEQWLRQGPPAARVDEVRREPLEQAGWAVFRPAEGGLGTQPALDSDCSWSAWFSRVSVSISSSRSPVITSGSRYRVRLMRWSVIRPCGKL